MKKHKIAFIKEHGFHYGGTEICLQRFAAFLDKEKFAVDYFSRYPAIPEQEKFLAQDRQPSVKRCPFNRRHKLRKTDRGVECRKCGCEWLGIW